MDNIKLLKEDLAQFHEALRQDVDSDEEYKGEIDGLFESLTYVQKNMKDVNTQEELDAKLGEFGTHFNHIMSAINEIALEDGEFDFSEEDLDSLLPTK